jgi:hypothetical protein
MKSLQNQYNLIKEGKGSKDTFLKSVKSLFPNYIPSHFGFNETVNILKEKSIISENIGGIVTNGNPTPPDWFKIFKETVSEAKAEEKKPTKEVTDTETTAFDYKDPKNIDNIYGPTFLKGFYTEMNNPKNENRTVDEIKSIVAKNLAKNITHYTEKGQFGLDGVGYQVEHPGLGTPKEAKGKYKSSGYGDLNENKTPNNPYKLYSTHPEFKEAHQAISKILKTAKSWEEVQSVLNLYREAGADDTASRESIKSIFDKKSFNENRDSNYICWDAGGGNYEIKKYDPNISWHNDDDVFQGSYEECLKHKEESEEDSYRFRNFEPHKSWGNEAPDIYENEGGDFDGIGLIVTGRTQTDNNAISDMLDETGYHAVWNVREGYWFFPESEETLDSLEMELQTEFDNRDINARFEGQFNESLNEYEDNDGMENTYLELSNGETTVSLYKESGKWYEDQVLDGEKPYGWGSKRYMGYLSPQDIANYLRSDYGGMWKVVTEENKLNEYFAFGVSEDEVKLKVAKQEAEKISKKEGVVQHVNQKPSGEYEVSDWYDSETTVASYEFGQQINENMIKLKDLLEAEYYETFKEKEKKSTSKPKPKRAKTGDKIKAIETQGNIAALEAKIEALDEEIDSRETKMKMATENEEFKEFVNEKKVKAMEKEVKQLRKAQERYLKEYKKCTGEDYQAKKEIVDETFED